MWFSRAVSGASNAYCGGRKSRNCLAVKDDDACERIDVVRQREFADELDILYSFTIVFQHCSGKTERERRREEVGPVKGVACWSYRSQLAGRVEPKSPSVT